MKTRTKTTLLFSGSLLISVFLLAWTLNLAQSLSDNAAKLNAIAYIRGEIFYRGIIVDTHILTPSQSLIDEWEASNARLEALLSSADTLFINPEKAQILEKISEANTKTQELDKQIFEAKDPVAKRELQKELLVTRKALVDDGSVLVMNFRDTVAATQEIVSLFIIALTLFALISSLINLTWVRKFIARLTKANAELERLHAHEKEAYAELKSRTDQKNESEASLKEKIDQLERFNRLTVNRELEMIELKKKIKELQHKT